MPSTPCADQAHGTSSCQITRGRSPLCTVDGSMSAADTAQSRHEQRDLGRVLLRRQACGSLGRLLSPATGQLTLVGTSLARVDAYGGLVVRAAVDVHLRAAASHVVSVVEPVNDEPWRLLCDLLGRTLLPSRCSWAGNRSIAVRGSGVLVPVTAIVDEEQTQLVLDDGLRRATSALGYGPRAGRALQQAAAVFLHNSSVHAASSPIPPLVCASLEVQGNDLQVAVLDLGVERPAAGQGELALRAAVRGSREAGGSLHSLVAQRRGDLQVSVRLAWGTGRATVRSGGSWRYSESECLPGFMAGLEIHR